MEFALEVDVESWALVANSPDEVAFKVAQVAAADFFQCGVVEAIRPILPDKSAQQVFPDAGGSGACCRGRRCAHPSARYTIFCMQFA